MSRSSSPPPDSASCAGSKEPDVTILDSRRPRFERDAADRLAKPQPQRPLQQPLAQPDRDPMARLEALFDSASVRLLLPADTSGVLAAEGVIDGMPAVAFASDPRVQGGAIGSAGCAVIVTAYDRALEIGAPILGLWHSGGARLREGVESLHAVGLIFAAMTRASGKVPQISVVLGAAAGGAAYGPALTDLVILSNQGRIFVTGPDVVRIVAPTDSDAFARARELVTLLGHQVTTAKVTLPDTDLGALLPESRKRAYDVHPLINGLLDDAGI